MKTNISYIIFFLFSILRVARLTEFLQEKQDLNLKFEYSFNCGFSMNLNKNKITDITDEISKRNIDLDYYVVSHSGKKTMEVVNKNFNIFLIRGDKEILIATSDENDAKYNQLLAEYPRAFLNKNLMGIPSENNILLRKQLIDSIINQSFSQKELHNILVHN